jgi:hypothetical protein
MRDRAPGRVRAAFQGMQGGGGQRGCVHAWLLQDRGSAGPAPRARPGARRGGMAVAVASGQAGQVGMGLVLRPGA